MLLRYLFKLFFKQENGKYRKTFFLPIISIIIGSYIIFMTLSVMGSMEKNIIEKSESFDYEFYLDDLNDIALDNLKSKKLILNEGYTETVIISGTSSDEIVYLNVFKSLDNYTKQLSSDYFSQFDSTIVNNSIFIGSDLSFMLKKGIGDTVSISFPSKINIVTRNMPRKEFIINGIFNYDLYDYDSKYIFASVNDCVELFGNDKKMEYYVKNPTFDNVKFKSNSTKLLIDSLRLEKYIYTGLGILVILASSLMFFNIMMLSYAEKDAQILTLSFLGLEKKTMMKFIFLKNFLIGLFFSFLGFLLMELSIIFNKKIGLFEYIFSTFPFEINSMELSFLKIFAILITSTFIIAFSGILPLLLKLSNNNYVYDKD